MIKRERGLEGLRDQCDLIEIKFVMGLEIRGHLVIPKARYPKGSLFRGSLFRIEHMVRYSESLN